MKYGRAGRYVTYTGAERILSVSRSIEGWFLDGLCTPVGNVLTSLRQRRRRRVFA